jgi:RNA polymerase sigma factor for flagellar operon FliA
LKAELGREPSDKELAARLDLDENELFQLKTEICGAYIISLDHAVSAEEGEVTIGELTSATTPSPEDAAARAEAQQQLAEAIQRLPEQERQVITLYYYDALTLKEIGDVLNLSESRICQIHRTVIKKLQGRLRIGLRDAFH